MAPETARAYPRRPGSLSIDPSYCRSLLTWGEGGGVSERKARRGAEPGRGERGRSRERTAGFVLALRYVTWHVGPGGACQVGFSRCLLGIDGVGWRHLLLSGPSLRRALPAAARYTLKLGCSLQGPKCGCFSKRKRVHFRHFLNKVSW